MTRERCNNCKTWGPRIGNQPTKLNVAYIRKGSEIYSENPKWVKVGHYCTNCKVFISLEEKKMTYHKCSCGNDRADYKITQLGKYVCEECYKKECKRLYASTKEAPTTK